MAQKEAEGLRGEVALVKSAALVSQALAAPGGQQVLVARLDGVGPEALKAAADGLVATLSGTAGGAGVAVLLGSDSGDGKVGLVALFDKELQTAGGLKAGNVLGRAGQILFATS